MIEGGFSDEFNRYVLPVLKEWYNDNKEILKQIWEKDSIYRFWIGINMENTYAARECNRRYPGQVNGLNRRRRVWYAVERK